jgi:hypothetical protein
MPAQSKAQQRFMGMVHAAQKGELENPSPEVEKAADSMSDADAKDYASTKHKGLPNHVKKENMEKQLKEIIRQTYRESLRESINEDATELPQATIPASVKAKLEIAIDKIKDSKLSNNAKLQLIAQVVDALGVDKSQLSNIANKIRSKMESVNEGYPTDLKVGSVIMGQGFTMLKGIEGGKYYKVVEMDDYSATLVPSDKSGNVKGSKKVRHKLDSIEGGIKTAKRGDENGIVVVKESVNENKTYSNKFAAWFSGTVLNSVKHPTYGKHQLTADQIANAPADYKNKLFKAIETAVKNGDITPDIIKKNESVVKEAVSHEAMGIAKWTNTRQEAVQKFIDDNNLNAKEILTHVTKGKLPERIRFVQALVGTPNNSSFKWYVKNYTNESVVTESVAFNKKIKSELDSYLKSFKEGTPTHQWAVKEILKAALTDANFHSEAKKVDSLFSRAKYEEDSAQEKSYQNAVERKGIAIANKAKWDGYEIIDAISFYTSMTIGHPLGQKVNSLKESVTEGKKAFKVNPPIGKAKYSISSHNGSSTHNDGSDFWDIKIFKNKVDLEKGIKDFKSKGFIEESLIKEDIKSDINKFLDKLNKEFPEQEYTTDFKGGKYARIVQQNRKYSGNRSAWGFVSMEDNPSKGFKKGDLLKAAGFNTPAKGARGNILDGTAKYDKYSPIYLRGN